MPAEVSHGRGGAGNINVDSTTYVDGEVVREGLEGSHGDGAYSAGRGGAGNITDVGAAAGKRQDRDVVPDAAVRPGLDGQDFHTGRGGAGNEQQHAGGGDGGDGGERAARARVGAPARLGGRLRDRLLGVFRK